ncbi:cellulose 1,4-beta-cellobiosidase [Spinactinospora alkalitolerans]|uniref:Glucanase n=1 Tax=Spinactinospora alkalitolerans TaxID=687207 RepID=A0A852U886_9ACTN|nr:glycoside hydrolase family 6 protein [Spinactinospora alkalitolerans]NYE50140.1 cellulose 1,4-beta-cellobiosidase [Spinactinospora alkalitolerans]
MRSGRKRAVRSGPARAAAAASAFALGCTALVATSGPAGAATGCEVEYTVVNEWSTGFTAGVTVTNLGDALDGWTLEWDFAGDQQVGNGWNGSYSQSGQHVTVEDAGYNGTLGTEASVEIGFNGTYSGSNSVPSSFTLNGVECDGGTTDPTDPPEEPDPDPTDPPEEPEPGERVDNPYVGADVYVNPQWAANAEAEPGGDAVADEPTAVWLDQISAIEGNDSPTTGSMGLVDHLDEAVEQANGEPLVFQVVIYNLPGRDCAALASNGTLGPEEIGKYKNDYIDVIAEIIDRPEYSDLRIVTTIEPDSLPNLVTNVGGRETATENCDEMLENGNYVEGVAYALEALGAVPNVYNYVDAGHHGWIGWEDNFGASVDLFYETAQTGGASPEDVHGFIVNTANYSALVEPYFDVTDNVNGQMVRQSDWVDWNNYADELSFAQALRDEAVSTGFPSDIGMLIDTSRNGWGGDARPTGPGPQTSVNDYVNEGRVDRRIHLGNWCNQSGAGLGERPTAAPESGIDAYVWVKPPGESDGSSEEIPNDEGKGFDRMCDPTYGGNPRNGDSDSGALANAPISGHWFSEQFQELLANAYPPVQ